VRVHQDCSSSSYSSPCAAASATQCRCVPAHWPATARPRRLRRCLLAHRGVSETRHGRTRDPRPGRIPRDGLLARRVRRRAVVCRLCRTFFGGDDSRFGSLWLIFRNPSFRKVECSIFPLKLSLTARTAARRTHALRGIPGITDVGMVGSSSAFKTIPPHVEPTKPPPFNRACGVSILLEMSKQKQKGISFGYCDLNTGQRVYPSTSDAIPEELLPAQQLYQASDSMYAGITCVPPIGQPTVLPRDQDSVSALDGRSRWANTEVVRFISLFCLKRMLRR